MARAFADITFTPSVKAAQSRYGSRESNAGFEQVDEDQPALRDLERDFIAQRDSFYQATVSENGWPYVQHRGGAKGFLQVLDDHRIGFADFSGNRQYLSVGNLDSNERISLILMDYINRRRLKIWGRVEIVHESENPQLIAQLEVPSYRARIERAFVIHVDAFDWNCPQHITPRYSEEELSELITPLQEEIARLQTLGSAAEDHQFANQPLGSGELELVVTGVRQLTPRVRAYELRSPLGDDLPAAEAGAHISVPVLLSGGVESVRHYSISSNPRRLDAYEIAVQLEEAGDGGSAFLHNQVTLGTRLRCSEPRNDFVLHEDQRPAVLIAGGIGITAIKAMALALKNANRPFHLHYVGRSINRMAYRDRLLRQMGEKVTIYAGDQGQRLDIARMMKSAPEGAVFYGCGPQRLLDDLTDSAEQLAISLDRVRMERFMPADHQNRQPFTVQLQRSGKQLQVAADQSLLEVLEVAGVPVPVECRVGNCGTCAVKVIEGEPDHRDVALSTAQRTRNKMICVCVSRSRSETLVLDL